MRPVIVYLALFAATCAGCMNNTYSPAAYIKWAENEENGLRVKRVLNNFEFILQYKTPDYMIAQEMKSNNISKTYAKERSEILARSIHFNFVIRSADGKTPVLINQATPGDYFDRINHFLSEGQNDFKIRSGNDTFDCTLCHLEQNYGIAPQNTIVLAFEPRAPLNTTAFADDLLMIYEDKVFGTGTLKMKIRKENLEHLPQMKLN